jgi:valyl-tRNA synthetase
MPHDLPKIYDPTAIEDRWATYWVEERIFDQPTPEAPAGSAAAPAQPAFTMLLPPPNVTGRLHMGHMLNQTEMDILARWHRMSGDPTLWVPGTDHAGIATQMMVERQLISEGTSRQQIGRERFLERVHQWKALYGGAILEQMKRLGASVDWSREYYTMDHQLSVAVKEAFVRLWEQGLIYRGNYIVNWDPVQQTAVSDLEVTHEDRMGKIYYVRYMLVDGAVEGGTDSIVIATTRPETMLGDAAVAVHPEDERYKPLQGRLLRLPLSGIDGESDRTIPIVADGWANPEFGTGAVKVTPAHDPNDYAIGQRHGLPQPSIMDTEARIDLPGSSYHGLDRYAARERIVEDLRALGLLVDIKEHPMSIGLSQRTGAVIEPRLSTQWFLRAADFIDDRGETRAGLGRRAREAVAPSAGEPAIRFTPDQHRKVYLEWMDNIHDWCLSRQLWWGHQIPAWYCATCLAQGKPGITVARQTPTACPHCGGSQLTQETDVLDTWFSAGLLPFTVFGWPQQTPDLAALYPTQLLVTGFDILFFWVARMIMLGTHFMLDQPMPDGSPRTLADAVPFRDVYIHALVRDADKQKMSKTKGNVIDPIEIVKQYGTDAVRFTLAAMASPGTDIAFSEARTEGYRAFANKIWNAARFIFMNVDRSAEIGIVVDPQTLTNTPPPDHNAPIEARWITSRLNSTAAEVSQALAEYRFHEAASLTYQFFWGHYCDWYLEMVKLRLDFTGAGDKAATRAALTTLLATFEAALRLLSPFMPFLTEELWHAVYQGAPPARSIALSRFPQTGAADAAIEQDMSALQELIAAIRAARKDLGVEEKATSPIRVRASAALQQLFAANQPIIARLAKVDSIEAIASVPQGAGVRSTPSFDVQVVYERQVDVLAERERLTKALAQYEKEQANANRQLGNESFLAKAPPAVVEGIQRRAGELIELISKTRTALEELEALK